MDAFGGKDSPPEGNGFPPYTVLAGLVASQTRRTDRGTTLLPLFGSTKEGGGGRIPRLNSPKLMHSRIMPGRAAVLGSLSGLGLFFLGLIW